MTPPNSQRHSELLTVPKRLALVALTLVLGWHLFASFLWIAPVSALREVVPGNALERYMIPMFGQSWSVFAPDPISADYYFDVRAVIVVDGEETATEWLRASDVELSRATHHLFPPRSSSSAIAQAMSIRSAWDDLSRQQKDVSSANYYEGDDWHTRMIDSLAGVPGDHDALEQYRNEDTAATAYSTQVALAVWGDSVQRIQYRVARHPVVSFDNRNDTNPARPDPSYIEPGWRGLVQDPEQSQILFATYFCSAPSRACEVDA